MIKTWKAAFGAIALSVTMFGAGAAFTGGVSAQPIAFATMRAEYGSAHNIINVKTRLEGLIDQLQRDERDYGGHRVAAIDAMQRARGDLQAAIDYDATHRR